MGYRSDESAGMAQWWERSPPTNVARVRFLPRVICGLSLLLVLVLAPRVFPRVLRFSSLHKNYHSKFQFDQDREPASKPAKIVIYYYRIIHFVLRHGFHRPISGSSPSLLPLHIPFQLHHFVSYFMSSRFLWGDSWWGRRHHFVSNFMSSRFLFKQ